MKVFVIYQKSRATKESEMMDAGELPGFMKLIGVRQLVDGCKDPHPELFGRPTFEGFWGQPWTEAGPTNRSFAISIRGGSGARTQ